MIPLCWIDFLKIWLQQGTPEEQIEPRMRHVHVMWSRCSVKMSSWDGLLVNYRTTTHTWIEDDNYTSMSADTPRRFTNDWSGIPRTLFSGWFNLTKGGQRYQSSCQRFQTYNIDIWYSIIGKKYVGFNPLIMVLEEPDITIRFHSDIWLNLCRTIPIDDVHILFPKDLVKNQS